MKGVRMEGATVCSKIWRQTLSSRNWSSRRGKGSNGSPQEPSVDMGMGRRGIKKKTGGEREDREE